MMARGALITLQQLNLPAGLDIKIATHSNQGSPGLAPFAGSISLMEIDPTEIVGALFSQLETLMNGEEPPDAVMAIKPRLAG